MSPASESSIVSDMESGHHLFTIDGYSGNTFIPTGQCIRSSTFNIGGHRWCIDYYPNGVCYEVGDYISISLVLDEDVAVVVNAMHRMRLIGEAGEEQAALPPSPDRFPSRGVSSYTMFIRRVDLESSKYLSNDSFTIRCDIRVVNGFRVKDTQPAFVSVPPSCLSQDLSKLLETEKGADVVFEVGGETIAAHRWLLAARSPVFAAELFGPMKEGNAANAGVVRVEDVEAEVFKALLHYVYTDSLPEMCKEEEDVTCQHLLVAADRYSMKRLRLICEDKLCQYINVDSAAIILALAVQHHCEGLKKACFHFLATPANLTAVVATDGFHHMNTSCPSLVAEIITKCYAYAH